VGHHDSIIDYERAIDDEGDGGIGSFSGYEEGNLKAEVEVEFEEVLSAQAGVISRCTKEQPWLFLRTSPSPMMHVEPTEYQEVGACHRSLIAVNKGLFALRCLRKDVSIHSSGNYVSSGRNSASMLLYDSKILRSVSFDSRRRKYR
jgi:hypothetical protein